jgi:hypothetical protein
MRPNCSLEKLLHFTRVFYETGGVNPLLNIYLIKEKFVYKKREKQLSKLLFAAKLTCQGHDSSLSYESLKRALF